MQYNFETLHTTLKPPCWFPKPSPPKLYSSKPGNFCTRLSSLSLVFELPPTIILLLLKYTHSYLSPVKISAVDRALKCEDCELHRYFLYAAVTTSKTNKRLQVESDSSLQRKYTWWLCPKPVQVIQTPVWCSFSHKATTPRLARLRYE